MSVRGDEDQPYRVPLSSEERSVLVCGLAQWDWAAHPGDALAHAMGFDDVGDLLHGRGARLRAALDAGEALSSRDWRRVLVATAIYFADDSTGAGVDWPTVTGHVDGRTIAVLRALQRRVRRMAPERGEGLHDALTDAPAHLPDDRKHVVAIAPTVLLDDTPGAPPVQRWSQGDAELVSWAIDLAAARTTGRAPRLTLLPTTSGDHPEAIEATVAMLQARRPDVQVDVLRLVPRPNVGDLRDHLCGQDVILVPDGSPTAASALWAAHGVPLALLHAWRRGAVLIGVGAGALCWHANGLTTDVAVTPWIDPPYDALPAPLAVFTAGLGFQRHSLDLATDDPTADRAGHYRRLVGAGMLDAGYAIDAGIALHYSGDGLRRAVTTRPGARAWRVQPTREHHHREEPVPVRQLPQTPGGPRRVDQ